MMFNDPFDMQWDVLWQLKTPHALEYERDILKKAIEDPTSWPVDLDEDTRRNFEAHRKMWLAQLAEQGDGNLDRFIQELLDSSAANTGFQEGMRTVCRHLRVFCATECDRNVLMWSHYADMHRGVVIGFNVACFEEYARVKVEYPERLPEWADPVEVTQSRIFGTPNPLLSRASEMAVTLMRTKHIDWAYEREWRFSTRVPQPTESDYSDFGLPSGALLEVVAGYRTDSADFDYLFHLACKINADIKCSKMSPHPSEFKLVKTEFDPLVS